MTSDQPVNRDGDDQTVDDSIAMDWDDRDHHDDLLGLVEPAQPSLDVTPTYEVVVIRSANRRRTISAVVKGTVIEVRIPARLSKADEESAVAEMVAKLTRKKAAAGLDLAERTAALARRYHLPQPASVRWVSNMGSRWGSCTPADRAIRISDSLAGAPLWVLDSVIVHELCHLVEASHNARFWQLANQYPLMERARGYLIAKLDLSRS
jgi:predicted metal-dependent hydrolase